MATSDEEAEELTTYPSVEGSRVIPSTRKSTTSNPTIPSLILIIGGSI
jgi:hypothetical protein